MIVAKTPLRMSFFGGGTDFPDYYEHSRLGYGTVLSTTINMYTYIMVCSRFDKMIRVCYREQEMVSDVDAIQHNIVREAMKIIGVTSGIDIVYSANIPISTAGVGLASSSSMAVGLLNALGAFAGTYLSPAELARQACEIEITHLKNPIGIQDQHAVAYGGMRQYKFHNNGSITHEMPRCPASALKELHSRLMLFYTGIKRRASDVLQEQKVKISQKMQVLDELASMADTAYIQMCQGDTSQWGHMLHHAWQLKRSLASKVSNEQLDTMYDTARKAGAEGGKILGAGGGGFLLLYVPVERQEDVRQALHQYREVPFQFEATGSRIVFAE